jgi:DNA-directed RNA polymerase specialized sigma24 family protein
MFAHRNFRQSEFREKVTGAILEMLADLPETLRNTFIWSHYRGYRSKQIADILRCSPSEVEATLAALNSILHQRTHNLLVEDPQLDAEMELPATFLRNDGHPAVVRSRADRVDY